MLQIQSVECLKQNIRINEHTIGGAVSGLSGSVVLQNNSTDNETLSSDGAFTFSTAISEGSPYAAALLTQPTGQTDVYGYEWFRHGGQR